MSKVISKLVLVTLLLVTALPVQALPFQSKTKFIGMTKTVHRGEPCSVTVQTLPNSLCQITVQKPNGTPSRHPNLGEKRADAAGTVNWQWQMVEDAQPGDRLVTVQCIDNNNRETIVSKKMRVIK